VQRERLNATSLTRHAADLADEIGFEALTPSALARRVGVTVPSLYSHVTGAQGLRIQVSLLALQELADLLSDALAGRAGAHALAALGDTYRSYARSHPGRWSAATLRLGAEDAAASAGPRLARLMREALSSYGLQGDEEAHALRLVGSTLRGFVDLEATGSFDHSPPSSDASWGRAIEALDALLGAWSANGNTAHTRGADR
jgi:AcrR family transcriptional regulator